MLHRARKPRRKTFWIFWLSDTDRRVAQTDNPKTYHFGDVVPIKVEGPFASRPKL